MNRNRLEVEPFESCWYILKAGRFQATSKAVMNSTGRVLRCSVGDRIISIPSNSAVCVIYKNELGMESRPSFSSCT